MTTLTVIADGVWPSESSDLDDYVRDVTRSIVATAPRNCEVEAFLPRDREDNLSYFQSACPQASITRANRVRSALVRSWSLGMTSKAGLGLSHAPSLFAPLRSHDGVNDGIQTTVTIHDTTVWTHPQSYQHKSVTWFKSMARRALKHADAVVVPSHTVAENLSLYANFGDRVRVIGRSAPTAVVNASTAANSPISPPLPHNYVVAQGNLSEVSGLVPLVQALSRPELSGISLVIVSDSHIDPRSIETILASLKIETSRVRILDKPHGNYTRTAFAGALAYVSPGKTDAFDASMLTAFSLETPVIHASSSLLNELSGGSGVSIDSSLDGDNYVDALADAIAQISDDSALHNRLVTLGTDRIKAFAWRETGDRIWQLHAEL